MFQFFNENFSLCSNDLSVIPMLESAMLEADCREQVTRPCSYGTQFENLIFCCCLNKT